MGKIEAKRRQKETKAIGNSLLNQEPFQLANYLFARETEEHHKLLLFKKKKKKEEKLDRHE